MSISALPTAPFHRGSGPRAIGIISSAGGIPALFELLTSLPADFPYPLFITQHLPRNASSLLPEL